MLNSSCKIEETNENNLIKEEQSEGHSSAKSSANNQPEQNQIALEFPTNLSSSSNIISCKFFPETNEIICFPGSGEKKFRCNFPNCNAQFSQSSNLKRHFRIHTSEKPYICKTCDRAFNTSSNLKQHLQVHLTKNERKKFICRLCNKEYYYASNLKMHTQLYHSIKQQSPPPKIIESQLKTLDQSKQLLQANQPSSQIYIKHNDHIDLLINGYLYFYDGKTVYVHQLESTDENKYDEWGCYPICELSHYSSLRELSNIYKAVEKTLDYKITYNQLMNQNNCNAFICTCKLMKEHSNDENCVNNLIKSNQQSEELQGQEGKSQKKGLCFCNETKQFIHKHSENCGHIPIMHAGHIDYIVNGYLHFQHFDHCDNHGKIQVITEDDLRNQQNPNLTLLQQLQELHLGPNSKVSFENGTPAFS
eukprot:TRINITY_DN3455_c0_g1_i4.p1 TRINITY_DN3455_c0_g1~~TRINITY_DN3455_c0_g1_i4.p1  ORF type:complete len:419 (+),score=61.06 TRINITY_DN3455_c0_g1_i4:175-1431(+)